MCKGKERIKDSKVSKMYFSPTDLLILRHLRTRTCVNYPIDGKLIKKRGLGKFYIWSSSSLGLVTLTLHDCDNDEQSFRTIESTPFCVKDLLQLTSQSTNGLHFYLTVGVDWPQPRLEEGPEIKVSCLFRLVTGPVDLCLVCLDSVVLFRTKLRFKFYSVTVFSGTRSFML